MGGLGAGEGPFPAMPLSQAALTLSAQQEAFLRRILMGACGRSSPGLAAGSPHCGGDTRDTGKACMRQGLVRGRRSVRWGVSLRPGPLSTPTSSVLCSPACNPNACRASGRGLQPKGVRVKEVADFKVFTKGAGSGELKVTVKGPSKCQGPGPERGWDDRVAMGAGPQGGEP